LPRTRLKRSGCDASAQRAHSSQPTSLSLSSLLPSRRRSRPTNLALGLALALTATALNALRKRLSQGGGGNRGGEAGASGDGAPSTTPAGLLASLRADGTARLLTSTGEVLDDACVDRWVRARKGDVALAGACLRAHAAWRAAEVGPGRATFDEASLAPVLDPPRVFLQGLDTRGRPVLLIRVRSHARGRANETARLVGYALDAAFAAAGRWGGGRPDTPAPANPGRRLVLLLDLRGLRLSSADPRALGSLATMLANHYPERLDVFYMVGAPAVFWGLWRMMQPFIVPGVKAKIKFVKACAPELAAFIPPDVLPVDMGGAAPFVPVEAAVAAARAAEAAAMRASRTGSSRLAAALHLPASVRSLHLPSHLPARPRLLTGVVGAGLLAALLSVWAVLVALVRLLGAAAAGGEDWLAGWADDAAGAARRAPTPLLAAPPTPPKPLVGRRR
jgi:hypothetical protein